MNFARVLYAAKALRRPTVGHTYVQFLRTLWAFVNFQERIPELRWLYVEVTNVCNLKCKFCAYPKVEKKISRSITSQANFIDTIEQALDTGITRFGLTPTVGDVFVDRKFLDKLEYLEEKTDVDAYRFTTNLILPSQEMVRNLLQLKKLEILGISVYGHTEELFGQMTRGNRNGYVRLLQNLSILEELNTLQPKVNIGLRTERSFSGIQESNSDLCQLLLKINEKHTDVTIDCNQWYDNWAGLITDVDVVGLDIEVPEEAEIPKIGPCSFLFHKNLLTNDGDVLACACRDVERELKLGNYASDKLQNILGPENKALRTMIDAQMQGNFGNVCKSCTAYQSIYDVRRSGISMKEWERRRL